MTKLTAAGLILFIAGIGLFLVQLWGPFLSPAIFAKLLITDGALLVILIVAAFLMREHRLSAWRERGPDLS